MNLFAQQIKFEDTEGLEYPEGQLITEGDEGESVAAAVAEVTEEEAGIAEDERAMDGLVEDEETLSEVQEVVEDDAPKMEHTGLTPVGARLAKIVLARVVGKRHADKTLPKMEHFNSRSDARDATSFVQEGVADALKSFWEALKAQFKKIWAKVKTWYIKTFSAAKSLHDRAKTIRDRAESSTATIDKKSFQFGQVKQLAVEGRLKEVSSFEQAFNRVVDLVSATNSIESDKALEDFADGLDKLVDSKTSTNFKLGLLSVAGSGKFLNVVSKAAESVTDPKVLSSLGGGDNGDAQVSATDVLPGDKVLVVITAKDQTNALKTLRMERVSFANTKNKPREISSDAEATTLNPSQIAKFCDAIVSSAGDIADFEQKWQKIDKAQENVLRKIDEVVRDGVQDNKDDDKGNSTVEREIRTLASAATNYTRRMGGLPSQIASFAMPIYAATLNWCEGSMRNYKK
jgi:hypothetical protein